MSYRCTKCKTICQHSQIRVVTDTRERNWPKKGREIAREEQVCRECAVELKINVPAATEFVPNGHSIDDDVESSSVLVGSA